MPTVYLSPHLSVESSGGTLVAKSNLQMIQKLLGEVSAYAVCRAPMTGTHPLGTTRNTAGTAWANIQGLCATLSAVGRHEFIEAIRSRQPKVVWLDTSLFGRLIPAIRHAAPKARIITYFHNAEIDLLSMRIRRGQIQYLPAWAATLLNERGSQLNSDAILTITGADRKRLCDLYSARNVHVLPISLSPAARPESILPGDSVAALFVGSDFGPNVEGLKFLLSDVAPRLKRGHILVAGKGLARHLGGQSHPRLRVLGFVDDLSQAYSQTRVALAPIFAGGGMKVKIAEALKYNRPVIATPFAAIGYECVSGDSILRVDSAEAFARAIDFWNPPPGHRPVDEFMAHYSIDANVAHLSKILNEIGIEC